MFSQNFHSQILVGGAANKTTTNFASTMNTGEIGIFTPGGTRYTEATADADDPFVIALKRTDSTLLTTQPITKSLVKRVSLIVAVADSEQIDFVGYNGSTGSITTNDDTFYRIRVWMREGYQDNIHGTEYEKHAVYESDASATQAEIAIGLAGNGQANMSREPKNSSGNPFLIFKAICDVAASATNDFDNDVSIVKGAKTFVVATNLQYNGGGGTLAVGDFIRIADDALNGTLALTDNVYKVTAINSLTVTVDRPIMAATGTWTDAGDGTQVIPAATGIAANWGVGLYGQAQDFSANSSEGVKLKYKKTVFTTQVNTEAFGSTLVTKSQAASLGVGQYEQVAEMELFMNGNNGEFFRMGQPNLYAWTQQSLSSAGSYDLLIIELDDTVKTITTTTPNPKQIILALPATAPNYAIAGTADDITDVLEDLLTGVPVYNASKNGTALAAGDLAIS